MHKGYLFSLDPYDSQVDEFGTQKNCVPGLISLVNAFAEPTFVILNSPEALEQNPDTVEDFFR